MLVGSFGSVICTDKVDDDARIVVNARHDSNRQGCPGPVAQSGGKDCIRFLHRSCVGGQESARPESEQERRCGRHGECNWKCGQNTAIAVLRRERLLASPRSSSGSSGPHDDLLRSRPHVFPTPPLDCLDAVTRCLSLACICHMPSNVPSDPSTLLKNALCVFEEPCGLWN
jgi:hypothetical protein